MKKLLNILFVTTKNTYLTRKGETVLIKVGTDIKHQFPIHILQGIVCFGPILCSPCLMHLCAQSKVSISFLSDRGKFLARVQGPICGNVLLRREQYRQADNAATSLQLAKSFVTAKMINARAILLRTAREASEESKVHTLNDSIRKIARLIESLDSITSLDILRGIEGDAAKAYFGAFDTLIKSQKDDFYFTVRSRRPPLDNVNALMSFIYTLLAHDVASALETVGLDPAVGYLHQDRSGRPSLALDMMEEFRSFIADRLVLTLINRLQVKPNGFSRSESGDIRMNDETRKEVLQAYQKRKQEEICHPFIKEQVSIGLLPHIQALLLARYLRGDLDGYPPFIWR